MKELYIAPKLELLCMAPQERVAAELDFDSLLADKQEGVNPSTNVDIDVPLIP